MSQVLRTGQRTAPAIIVPPVEPKMGDRPVAILRHPGRMSGISKKLLLGTVFVTNFAIADARQLHRVRDDHSSYATGGLIMTSLLVATFAGFFCLFYRR